jgi:hypothetical protein
VSTAEESFANNKILRNLRKELEIAEREHFENQKLKAEKEARKSKSRENSLETKAPIKPKVVLPPTKDELLLFGDILITKSND